MSGGMDPFAGILLEMQDQARTVFPPSWCLGRVTASAPGVLRIQANGMELDEEDLWVDPRLLMGHELPAVRIQLTMPEDADEEDVCEVTMDMGGEWIRTWIPLGEAGIDTHRLYTMPGRLTGVIRGTVELLDNRLQVGDWVVLLPDQSGDYYYVLTKVVRPHDVISPD